MLEMLFEKQAEGAAKFDNPFFDSSKFSFPANSKESLEKLEQLLRTDLTFKKNLVNII